ncbi:APH domain-containing protein [Ceratobasidium sp. AG-Ba]|nr:APH domain-containing protein [Ceratobasidium sp. AG-Ba]
MPASSRPIVYGTPVVPNPVPSTPARSQKRKTRSFTSTKDSHGIANTTTPYRVSSGQRNKEGAGNASTSSRLGTSSKSTSDAAHAASLATPLAVPDPPKQLEMDEFLEAEMQGAIFCDPKFVDNFLSPSDASKLDRILSSAESDLDGVVPTGPVGREKDIYIPLCRTLNIIKRAVDEESGRGGQPPAFVDAHLLHIGSHFTDIAGIQPDLLWYDGPARHWETVRMPVEVKLKTTYLKAGMKQLTRYARAVFAHQLHRRHLYGMVVCQWDATIVRFDRSGILYSEPMDVRLEDFRRAFAELMMLDDEGAGFDTAFTTRFRDDGRLEYYVDLPEGAFAGHEDAFAEAETDAAGPSTSPAGPSRRSTSRVRQTRRLKVVRVLCHRKTIRGRATTVLRVRPVLRRGRSVPSDITDKKYPNTRSKTKQRRNSDRGEEVLGTRDFVLKLMWRDPNKRAEGEVMERMVGVYGVGQYMWHSDVYKACSSPNCTRSVGGSCGGCLDRTPDRGRVKVSPNMMDLNIAIPEAKDDEEPQYEEIGTDNLVDAYDQRASRTYCRLLMSTVGSPLCSADNVHDLLRAILDAILGYWKLLNMGLLHRDISDGNVLLLKEPHKYRKRLWQESPAPPSHADPELIQSELLLQEELRRLGDPIGILNDFDLFALHGPMGASFFGEPGPAAQNRDSEEEWDSVEPESKRRKIDPGRVVSPSDSSDRDQVKPMKRKDSTRTGISKADKGVNRNIDFRTGTPSFMSTRIIKLGVGVPYEHHFTDDLESFFWLILWCVVEHVDEDGIEPTQMARDTLHQLDRQSLRDIGIGKEALLSQCLSKGRKFKKTLHQCGNSWAKDPAVAHILVELGAFFFDLFSCESFMECNPSEVFPNIVNIVKEGLALK